MTAQTAAQPSGFRQQAALIVFSLTLFLSASLMFAIQPMTGKMLLPIVGGTPAGWIVAMAFFQIMLLVGYLAAHLLAKLPARLHAMTYIGLLCIGLVSMPVILAPYAQKLNVTPDAGGIFIILTFALALPFVAVSATSSTIQRLFTTTGHKSAHDPYFLYVASNIGSFSGLLLYPLVFEPSLALSEQTRYVTWFYCGLIALAAICLALSGKETKAEPQNAAAPAVPVTGAQYMQWMLLAFVPSSLLLGVTFYITTDIMSVPMMWVLPLALYLLTFVIAFSRKSIIPLWLVQALHPWAVIAVILFASIYKLKWLASWNGVFFYLGIFFIVALSCHLRLAALRPLDENRKHLTGFYLMMSVGGALGGIFNAFIVPAFAVRMMELPLILVFSLLLHPAIQKKGLAAGLICLICLISALTMGQTLPQFLVPKDALANLTIIVLMLITAIAFIAQRFVDVFKMPTLLGLTALLFLLSQFMTDAADIQHSSRNFYGTIRVFERMITIDNPLASNKEQMESKDYKVRFIVHGTTTHGLQILEPPEYRNTPTLYFSPRGPLGDAFEMKKPKQVAVIGLGAGVINCYNAPDRHFTFIEIDPDMVTTAENYFTFLSDCKSAAPPKIIVGDGRLELARMEDRNLDMIIVDAFSSDSIPTHLLTKEAIDEYMKKLKPDGILVLHLSNRFFYLESLFAAYADAFGLQNRFSFFPYDDRPFTTPSRWMVLAGKEADLSKLTKEKHWQELDGKNTTYWTDDYTNIMSVIHLTPPESHTYRIKGQKQ